MNNKRKLVILYKDIELVLHDNVYQQQPKSRDSNACLSDRSWRYNSRFGWWMEWADKVNASEQWNSLKHLHTYVKFAIIPRRLL